MMPNYRTADIRAVDPIAAELAQNVELYPRELDPILAAMAGLMDGVNLPSFKDPALKELVLQLKALVRHEVLAQAEDRPSIYATLGHRVVHLLGDRILAAMHAERETRRYADPQ